MTAYATRERPSQKDTAQTIQAFIRERNIKRLVHFTRVENLASIVLNGLVPVEQTEKSGLNPVINDVHRLDGYRNATSLSISTPNSKMLYRYHMELPSVPWSVLVLSTDILFEKACAFCRYNAADSRIRSRSLPFLRSIKALQGMFEEAEGETADWWLRPNDSIDEQAEVLVFDVIEPKYIQVIIVADIETRDSLPAFVRRNIQVLCDAQIYSNRKFARTNNLQTPLWT